MRISFFIGLLFCCLVTQAIGTKISGSVKSEYSREPIPFANVVFKGTSIGVQTDLKGHFELYKIPKVDTLTISALGYVTQNISILGSNKRNLDVVLAEESYTLGEIVVHPTENPAFAVIRNAIKQREHNNPDNLQRFRCRTYTKLAVYVDKAPKSDSVFIDKALKREIKRERMPIFFSEKVANNTINRTTGQETMELLSNQQSGLGIISDIQIDGYSSAMSTEVNFYQNNIELFGKVFPNPIGDNAFSYYKYRITDSVMVGDFWKYTIDFRPKYKKDLAFKGTVVIVSDLWSISNIQTELPKEANINFINSFEVKYDYQRVGDSIPFFQRNEVKAKLYYKKADNTSKVTTLTINKSTLYSDVSLGGDSALALQGAVPNEMMALRPVELSPEEQKMHHSIDSLNNLSWMKVLDKFTTTAITGYFPLKKIDLGPYDEYVKHNRVEGLRLTLAARTGESFSPNYSISGKLGYGFRDRDWKYGSGFTYKPKLKHRTLIGVEFDHDMTIIGSNGNMRYIRENAQSSDEDNIFTVLASRRPNDRVSMRDRYSLWGEQELKRGLVVRLRTERQRIETGLFVPFTKNGIPVPEIYTNAITFEGRFSFKEKTIDKFIRRYYVGTRYPIINVALTVGDYDVLNKESLYFKAHATLKHNFFWGLGKFVYVLEGGFIAGKVPFPLLEIPRGNETFGFTRFRFNTMNNMELASDTYLSLFSEYHLNGFVVNRIPLIRALDLREVVSAKVLVASLSSRHREVMDFPIQLNGISEPFVEIGGGFENIFHFFRLEAIYRVASQPLYHTPKFAIKARFQVEF